MDLVGYQPSIKCHAKSWLLCLDGQDHRAWILRKQPLTLLNIEPLRPQALVCWFVVTRISNLCMWGVFVAINSVRDTGYKSIKNGTIYTSKKKKKKRWLSSVAHILSTLYCYRTVSSWRPNVNRTCCPNDAKTVGHQTLKKWNPWSWTKQEKLKFISLMISHGTAAVKWLLLF